MNEASVVSLTAALRVQSVRSEQHPDPQTAGQWVVVADSVTAYTMTQLANLQTAHNVVAKTDRAEFGPGTAAQLAALEADLKAQRVEYHAYEKTVAGEWYLMATSGVQRTVAQVQTLEVAHGLTARTTRGRFE